MSVCISFHFISDILKPPRTPTHLQPQQRNLPRHTLKNLPSEPMLPREVNNLPIELRTKELMVDIKLSLRYHLILNLTVSIFSNLKTIFCCAVVLLCLSQSTGGKLTREELLGMRSKKKADRYVLTHH